MIHINYIIIVLIDCSNNDINDSHTNDANNNDNNDDNDTNNSNTTTTTNNNNTGEARLQRACPVYHRHLALLPAEEGAGTGKVHASVNSLKTSLSDKI